MAPQIYPVTTLDSSQVIQYVYDESTQTLRTTATATIIGGDMSVEIDGIYSGINLDPDNIGLIGHTRSLAPTDSDQTIRLTSIVLGTVRALDISVHNSDGSAIDAINPLFVTGTINSVQSGIWNINDISGIISLPTGASTSALQTSGNATLTSIDNQLAAHITVNQGSAALPGDAWYTRITDGSATVGITGFSLNTDVTNAAGPAAVNIQDGGNSITIDAVSLPLPTGASTSANQTTANTSLASIDAGIPAALGQTTMTNSMPVVIASDQSAISVTGTFSPGSSTVATYSAAITGLVVPASATDIFTITGSGTKTIKVKYVLVSATRTSDAKTDVLLVKRSTANSAGTSTSPTAVPHDSNNAAATGTILAYTANPTLGTTVGTIRSRKQYLPVASSSALESPVEYNFGLNTSQPIVLRGTSQVLAVNLNAQTISGPSFDISIEWTEE